MRIPDVLLVSIMGRGASDLENRVAVEQWSFFKRDKPISCAVVSPVDLSAGLRPGSRDCLTQHGECCATTRFT